LPNIPAIQLSKDEVDLLNKQTIGNGKFYCMDCEYTWKKYRGKKPYEGIKIIHAFVGGGYQGPYYEVKIDLDKRVVEKDSFRVDYYDIPSFAPPTLEDMEWFRAELYKCDFVNWAEEYSMIALDGTHWSVRIEYDAHCEIKMGSNHFPPKWTKFCKAVSKISGSDFY